MFVTDVVTNVTSPCGEVGMGGSSCNRSASAVSTVLAWLDAVGSKLSHLSPRGEAKRLPGQERTWRFSCSSRFKLDSSPIVSMNVFLTFSNSPMPGKNRGEVESRSVESKESKRGIESRPVESRPPVTVESTPSVSVDARLPRPVGAGLP